MKKFLIATAVIIGLVAATIVSISIFLSPNNLAGCGERPFDSQHCGAADAIVAVSGGDTNARTDEAIRRFRDGWAPLLIFSGAAQDANSPSNASSMKERAIAQGVPAKDILVEEFARNTAENAANTSKFIKDRSLTRIILVTSAYHQRRASIEFRGRLGPSVQIVNAPVTQDSQWNQWWWLTPRGWWLALGELAKIAAYYTSGGTE